MSLLDSTALTEAISKEDQRRDADMDDIVSRLRSDDAIDIPIELTDLDLWSNYMDEDLYEMDRKVREFLKRTRYKRLAKGGYRTTSSMVFAWIYGRQPEPRDGAVCRLLNRLLEYYCTSYTGRTTFNGKPVTRVYRFSKFATNGKRPYSLKLRMEEANGNGDVFKSGPNSNVSKRSHGRQPNRGNG